LERDAQVCVLSTRQFALGVGAFISRAMGACASSTSHKDVPYTIYYHGGCQGFTGRAFSPLCILEAAGQNYECKDMEALPKNTVTFAPPMVEFPDGQVIAQTSALCITLGQRLGLEPESKAQKDKALQLTLDVADLLSEIVDKKGAERLMKWVQHFEEALGDKKFFMGDQVTYVDYVVMGVFTIFPLKEEVEAKDFEGVSMTPKVGAWFQRLQKDQAVKKVTAMAPFLPKAMLGGA